MSPTKTSPDGTYRVDWRRREIGRVTVSSGAKTVKGWRQAMALLDALYDRGELDLLKAIKAGRVTLREVAAAEKAKAFGRGDALQLLALRRPLWETVDAWTATDDGVTMDRYRVSFDKLRSSGVLRASATLSDLGKVDWRALERSGGYASASDWNALRRAVSRFLTVTLGDVYNPVRRQIVVAIPKRAERPRKVTLGAAEFWRLVEAVPEVARAGVVTLAVTGMRLGEYERCRRSHLTDRIDGSLDVDVPGTKTDASANVVRVAPSLAQWVKAGVPMALKRLWFRRCFKKGAAAIGRPELRVHDLRHCTAMFALEGGAGIHQVRDLMRHERAEQTLDYARSGNLGAASDAIGKALAKAK